MELLPHLTSDDLKEVGVKSVGNRRKLLVAIAALSLKRGELQSQASPSGDLHTISTPAETERRHLSVLFCDLVGSTELAQRLVPEIYRALLLGERLVCTA